MKHSSHEVGSEQLITDINAMLADAEALLQVTADQGGEKMAEVRSRVETSLQRMKIRMSEVQTAVLVKAQEAARATDVYVHEKPWNAIGAAVSLGLLIGFLLGRRDS